MTFDDFLNRFRRIWHWSAATAIGFFLIPVLWVVFVSGLSGVDVGMHGLNEHPVNTGELGEWLIRVDGDCSLLAAVIAVAAGVTYFIGKTIAVPRARPPLDICLRRP
jgi:hypothetical protein